MRVLVIDNYDSFVYNLVQMVGASGAQVQVLRNDAPLSEAKRADPDAILISPGPGHPRDARLSLEVLREMPGVPTLGVCLGHQAIGLVFGARVAHAAKPMHGKTSRIFHNGKGLFRSLPSPLTATRYHSLVVTGVKRPLEIAARTGEGEVMALRHRKYPVEGVQFHPESVVTEGGKVMVKNFLKAVK
ncbi:MAG: aminodeoxychorismate/anthranilate synthase component II [Halobacteria archaeon]